MTPPITTLDLPAVGGQIGATPEDFLVEEIPKFELQEAGPQYLVEVEKRQWPTPKMTRTVARAAGVRAQDVGYAGMKDKHAVTTQWITVPGRGRSPDEWDLPRGMRVVRYGRASGKLRTGQLVGNRFKIRVTGAEQVEAAAAIAERISTVGIPNYFGAQRFGRHGSNLDAALPWIRDPRSVRLRPFERKLYASVVQSEIFNQYVSARLEAIGDTIVEGDVVRLNGSRSVFVVDDVDEARERAARGDVILTGPIWGSKSVRATSDPGALEHAAATAVLGDPELIRNGGKVTSGARRDLILRPAITVSPDPDAADALWLSFTLGPGAFATQIVREFTRTDWLTPRRLDR